MYRQYENPHSLEAQLRKEQERQAANDWVTCTFENEEQATKAADEYTEFFKEAE